MVSAHAIPVSMTPESSAVLDTVPQSITINFSERVDPGASSITITGPTTKVNEPVHIDPSDPRALSASVPNDGNGTYLVSWSAVSADDGHFTKGAYAFAVGKGTVIAANTESAEVVTITTTPEAVAMTVELMGNGIIWAIIFLLVFAIRPLSNEGKLRGHEEFIRRWCTRLMYTAVSLVVFGGISQLIIKSSQLASLQDSTFWHAFGIYLVTTAGSATCYRMMAAFAAFLAYVTGKKKIFGSQRFTFVEGSMILFMCIFAFFRAIVSHATANPFYPWLSISVNFFHVIEKDAWAGLVLFLVILAVHKEAHRVLNVFIPRVFVMLAVDFGLVSVTATYIVWLHLKDFGNLFTTQWGAAFIELFVAALVLVALRAYHVFARVFRPNIFSKAIAVSLGAEFAVALLVVYYSSVVIITSPPLPQPDVSVFSTQDQGATISLSRDQYEDGQLLLTTSADGVPVVTIEDESGSTGPVSVTLDKRFTGGYVFPQNVLVGQGPFKAEITVPQTNSYDAHASFEIPKGAFDPPPNWESERHLDPFTITMILIALSALGAAFILYYFSKKDAADIERVKKYAGVQVVAAFSLIMFVAPAAIANIGQSANPFKTECEADGNMWHLMQPMKAGVALSQGSVEGCMWGMGNYMYMLPDKREYDYYSSQPHAVVTLDHAPFVAGVPASFNVSLKETDGDPATLFVDMDKLIHVVIVSKDETVFAHIHPDDAHPLSQQEIDTSTFTLNYTFPKSGEYLIAVDYAHGLTLESKQFTVEVGGNIPQAPQQQTYASPGVFDGYTVSLDYFQPVAGQITTLKYTFTKDGKPVTNILPYLEAAMHISVVKNDFSSFLHVHGEVHPPGVPYPPIIIKNGQVIHSMAMMVLPPTLGPLIEAHLIFPTPGLYTVWGQFRVGDTVIPTSFTVRVE